MDVEGYQWALWVVGRLVAEGRLTDAEADRFRDLLRRAGQRDDLVDAIVERLTGCLPRRLMRHEEIEAEEREGAQRRAAGGAAVRRGGAHPPGPGPARGPPSGREWGAGDPP